jgi:hypothetical protein
MSGQAVVARISPPAAPPSDRVCRRCGKRKWPTHTQPDPSYSNLDIVTYGCDCGEDAGHYVARGA